MSDPNKIHHALQARGYCEAIKDGINGLCRILDIGDDSFGEMDRLESYKAIFRKAEEWQQQYDAFLQEQGETPVDSPVFEQTM